MQNPRPAPEPWTDPHRVGFIPRLKPWAFASNNCNDVDFYDCRLTAGATTTLPSQSGWHTYLYVFDGAVEVGDEPVRYTESALVTGDDDVVVTASEDATIVAFNINPGAAITRQGIIGC